jgi:ParB family chromosome partitioning protein
MGHGRAIINIEDLDIQTDIYQRIVSQNLSVRDTGFSKTIRKV